MEWFKIFMENNGLWPTGVTVIGITLVFILGGSLKRKLYGLRKIGFSGANAEFGKDPANPDNGEHVSDQIESKKLVSWGFSEITEEEKIIKTALNISKPDMENRKLRDLLKHLAERRLAVKFERIRAIFYKFQVKIGMIFFWLNSQGLGSVTEEAIWDYCSESGLMPLTNEEFPHVLGFLVSRELLEKSQDEPPMYKISPIGKDFLKYISAMGYE